MDDADPGRNSAFFVGDLADPWVAGLADALPPPTGRLDCPGPLPECWPAAARQAPLWVVHRSSLEPGDAERLRNARREGLLDRLILCLGSHTRYHQLQRWNGLASVVLGEATAPEVIGRHLAGEAAEPAEDASTRPVLVVSGNRGLREVLADACAEAGHPVIARRDWSDAPPCPVAVWDAPVLEPGWTDRLAIEAANRAIIALLGFADRRTVAAARRAGAAACLELPCDPADLAHVLRRVATGTAPTPMPMPMVSIPTIV